MSNVTDWVIVIAIVAVSFGVEHLSFKAQKRYFMWAAGVAGIATLIWFKGPEYVWSWLLAAGWLGVLVYFDHQLLIAAAEPNRESSRKQDDDHFSGGIGGSQRD